MFERTWADLLPTKPDRALLTGDPHAVRDWYRTYGKSDVIVDIVGYMN